MSEDKAILVQDGANKISLLPSARGKGFLVELSTPSRTVIFHEEPRVWVAVANRWREMTGVTYPPEVLEHKAKHALPKTKPEGLV